MRRHGRFRYGPRLFRPWGFFGGGLWVIILLMFLFGGRWWPGILVLIGLSVVFGSIFRASTPQWPQNPPPPDVPMRPPVAPTAAPAPATPVHRVDLLPATCPQCGGPIRAYEVKWTGAQSAACPFCGSNLPMKKM